MPDCSPAIGIASLRSPRKNPTLASADRRPFVALMTIEKRSTSQAQSQNDFFNLMRKKSSTNPSSIIPESGPTVPSSNLFQRMLSKISPLLDSQMGGGVAGVSRLSSNDSELKSLFPKPLT